LATLNEGYITIGAMSKLAGVSSITITRWYKWWKSPNFYHPEDLYLPPVYVKNRKGTRYFKEDDVDKLKKFSSQLRTTHKGVMAEFNAAYQWGKRGEKALRNKGMTVKEVKNKFY
jgi:hypothetical protein